MEDSSNFMTFQEFGQLLDEIAEELPQEIFVNLNGGINLIPDILYHPEGGEGGNLYILGQYHHGGNLGRYITIYYGSFMKLYGMRTSQFLKQELDRVVRHEFLHHLESMAGEKDLEVQDAIDLARYKAAKDRRKMVMDKLNREKLNRENLNEEKSNEENLNEE